MSLQNLIDESRALLEDEWRDAAEVAKQAADKYFAALRSPYKKTRGGDGWTSDVQVEVPYKEGGGSSHRSVWVQFRGQHFPKGPQAGYNFSIQLTGPSGVHNWPDEFFQIYGRAEEALGKWGNSNLRQFGKVTWNPDDGQGMAAVWVMIDDKKVELAFKKIPELAKKLASSLNFK